MVSSKIRYSKIQNRLEIVVIPRQPDQDFEKNLGLSSVKPSLAAT